MSFFELVPDSSDFIKAVGFPVDDNFTFCHCAGEWIVVVNAIIVRVPALDHLAVFFIANPLAFWICPSEQVFLEYIWHPDFFVLCDCAIVYGIQPIPSICIWIIDFTTSGN